MTKIKKLKVKYKEIFTKNKKEFMVFLDKN